MNIKRLLLFAAIAIGFASCQCADPPPVPPVEDEDATAQVVTPSSSETPPYTVS